MWNNTFNKELRSTKTNPGYSRLLNREKRQQLQPPINRRALVDQPQSALFTGANWVWTVSRAAIFILASFLTLIILNYGPQWIGHLSKLVFNIPHYETPSWVSRCLFVFFSFFIITAFFPFLLNLGWMILSTFQRRNGGPVPFVSIIIPAFNEEQNIHRSLEALRRLDYPAFEVIMVNDGSTDFTFSLIESSFVKCIHLRRNQGKAAALNEGISRAKGTIIVFSDSDSWFDPMALRYLTRCFADPAVGAVSGTVEISHPKSMLKRWQALEYIYGQYLVKAAQMGSGSTVAICPGPVGAYRRDLLLTMGGFKGRTITEDFDATLEIIKQGYRVVYAPNAVAYTEAPSSWLELKYQRLRWFRGHLQAFRIHRDLLGTLKAGALSLYWLPIYYLILGYGCGLIELLAIPAFPILVIASGNPWGLLQVTAVYIVFAALFVVTGCVIALWRSNQMRVGLIAAAFILYPYLFFMNWIRLGAVVNEVKGKISTWSG